MFITYPIRFNLSDASYLLNRISLIISIFTDTTDNSSISSFSLSVGKQHSHRASYSRRISLLKCLGTTFLCAKLKSGLDDSELLVVQWVPSICSS